MVAERACGGVALAALLHSRRYWLLSAYETRARATMVFCGDRVLCAESEPALSLDDGDDGAAVSGDPDLGNAGDDGVRRGDARGQGPSGEAEADRACAVDW